MKSVLVAVVSVLVGVSALTVPSNRTQKYCTLPAAGQDFQTATGAEVNIDQATVDNAVNKFSELGTVSIKVFRYNCLVAQSPLDLVTDALRKNIFSATKGIISILTGIAYNQGKLALDDPIDKYLPTTAGWGDAAHRAITIRQLLTETAGMEKGVIAEGITFLADASIPQEALAQKLVYPPGQVFQYSQRVPDLLAYVVARAVGQDLQTFAQTYLFTPIGIPQNSYIWLRDRSGNTYGYAYLYLSSPSFARLGLVMQNDGVWNGKRVLSSEYVHAVSVPSSTNGCYGLLFWTNKGDTCISPTGYAFPPRSWIPGTPRDLFAMSGSPQQKNFLIPSLNMTVSWAGVLNDIGPAPDTWYQFFKLLMPGVTDLPPIDPGVFTEEPSGLNTTLQALNLQVLLAGLISSPTCNILICNGGIPLVGLLQNLFAILGLTTFSLGAILNRLI